MELEGSYKSMNVRSGHQAVLGMLRIRSPGNRQSSPNPIRHQLETSRARGSNGAVPEKDGRESGWNTLYYGSSFSLRCQLGQELPMFRETVQRLSSQAEHRAKWIREPNWPRTMPVVEGQIWTDRANQVG